MTRQPEAGVHPVRVFTAQSLTEARLAADFLSHEGILAQVEDEHAHEMLGSAGHVFDAKGGGVGVVVASDREADAGRALMKFRNPAPFDDEDARDEVDDESG